MEVEYIEKKCEEIINEMEKRGVSEREKIWAMKKVMAVLENLNLALTNFKEVIEWWEKK